MGADTPSDRESQSQQDARSRASLVLRLRSMGITDHRLGSAFEATRRAVFAPQAFAGDADSDRLIPIPCGQTMEAPSVLARLLQTVPVRDDMVVLEIGAGSGYFTALLARLARRVVALERYRSLVDGARTALASQGIANVDVVLADGLAGWPAAGPYQAIFATGSVEALPPSWLAQLAPGGRLIAPLGLESTGLGAAQTWICFTKQADGTVDQQVIGPAFAVPLVPGLARAL